MPANRVTMLLETVLKKAQILQAKISRLLDEDDMLDGFNDEADELWRLLDDVIMGAALSVKSILKGDMGAANRGAAILGSMGPDITNLGNALRGNQLLKTDALRLAALIDVVNSEMRDYMREKVEFEKSMGDR